MSGPPSRDFALPAAATGNAGTSGNGTDANTVAPPSATQR